MAERLTFNHGAAVLVRHLHDAPGAAAKAPPATTERPPAVRPSVLRAAVERADLAYWAVFAFTGLLFFRPQDTLLVLAPLHLSEIVAVLGLVAMGVTRVMQGRPLVTVTAELAGVLGLAAVMLLTAPVSIWPGGALATFTDVYSKVALVYVLLTQSLRSPRLLRQFSWLIVMAMGYVAVRGVADYVRGLNLLVGGRLHGPVAGLMGNPNDLAMNMVAFLPLAGMLAIWEGPAFPRALAGLSALAMVATTLFTKSRAGMLGLVVMGVVFLWHARRIRPGIGVVVVIGALAGAPLLPASFWTRVSSIVNEEEDETGSRQARKELMLEAWQTFLERPLTGVGAGQFKNYNPPDRLEPWRETHNVLLQVLVELGAFGGLVFIFLLARGASALRAAFRWFPPPGRARRRGRSASRWAQTEVAFDPDEREWMRLYLGALAAGFAGWFVCAQFASIGYYWTFYYLLALIVTARDVTRARLSAVSTAPPVEYRG